MPNAGSLRLIPYPLTPGLMLYSQKGMATAPVKTAAAKNEQQGFVYLPLIAGWLFPGAGHFLLRKWGRGALLSASIVGMFVLGLAMKGKIYTGAQDILDMLGLVGDLGNGLLFFVSRILGLGADQVRSPPPITAPSSSSSLACSTSSPPWTRTICAPGGSPIDPRLPLHGSLALRALCLHCLWHHPARNPAPHVPLWRLLLHSLRRLRHCLSWVMFLIAR